MLEGTVDPAFQRVADVVEHQLGDGGGGAGAAVYHRGRLVVDVWGGVADVEANHPWHANTTVMAFSTSKGVVATGLHLCVDRGLLDYDDRVAEHWPEFAQHGKEGITVRHVLCHEAGLYDVESMLSYPEQVLEWEEMIAAIEGAEPAHEPGTANAYHAVTFGFLVGELIQRTTGVGVSEFIAGEIAAPLGLDGAFIGTPDDQVDRVAPLVFPEGLTDILGIGGGGGGAGSGGGSGMLELVDAMGLEVHPEVTRVAFGANRLRALAGARRSLRYPIPSFNGTFNAGSLARMYAALAAGGSLDGVTLLSAETLARATEIQNTRPDLAVVFPMQWRLGYHGVLTTAGSPPRGFGHVGLGGSGAWADPDRELAVAMVTNRLANDLVGDDRLMSIGGAAMTCADALDEGGE